MTLKRRVEKLESQAPSDKIVDFLGMKIKESVLKKAIESAEGTVLRPRPGSNRYTR